MTIQTTYLKDKLSNWFLIATFLLSVFSFSGYVPNGETKLQQTTQTELVSKYKTKKASRVVSFVKAFALLQVAKPPLRIRGYTTSLLLVYNRLSLTRFANISRQSLSIIIDKKSFPNKTIPQSTNELAYSFDIG